MGRKRKKLYTRYAVAADALGLTHLIIAAACIVLGEKTKLFDFMKTKHPGVDFVYKYMDGPVARYVQSGMDPNKADNAVYVLLNALMVIIVSSILYGVIGYIILRAIGALFGSKE